MRTDPSSWQPTMMKMIAELSVIKADKITPQHRLREDLGMDSVCSLELISMLAEEFGLNVSVEEATHVHTVQDALDLAQQHLSRRS